MNFLSSIGIILLFVFFFDAPTYHAGVNFIADFLMIVGLLNWIHLSSYLILDPLNLHPGSLFSRGEVAKGDVKASFESSTTPIVLGLCLFFGLGFILYFEVFTSLIFTVLAWIV